MDFDKLSRDELIQEIEELRALNENLKKNQQSMAEKLKADSFEAAQLLSIFESIQQLIYVADPVTYEVLFMNRFGKEAFGKDPVGGICYREFQGFESQCTFCTNDIIMENKGEPYQWEFHNDLLDRDYLITDRVIKWPDGRDVRMEFTIDVTELKQTKEALQKSYNELEERVTQRTAELRATNERLRQEIEEHKRTAEALKQSEARMELALKGADLGAWDYFPETGTVVFNERWAEMLGYSLDELEPHVETWEKMVHPDDMPHVMSVLNDHMQGRTPFYEAEHRLRNKFGDWKWILTKGKVVERNHNGDPLRMAGTHLDITDRKSVEQALEKYAEDLERVNAELDQFTYVASHDLQEPLRKLTSFSTLLREDLGSDLSEMAARDLDFITDAADRMKILIQDLLALSRIGRAAVKNDPVSLSECADAAIDTFIRQIEDKGAQISRDVLPEVVGDRTLIIQLYQNLIGNSLKYCGEKRPEVCLTAKMTTRGWVFGVKDNGIGIEPQYLNHIFLPFKRLHTRQAFPGTGIGLSICRKVVDLIGGSIWAESEGEGMGTHVKFTLGQKEETK